jgi:biofilm PGA synthesis N-glycosyltransferase PgaC
VKTAFWIAAAVVAYAYLGYAAWLWCVSRVRRLPLRRGPYSPSVSVVMVVRNEEQALPRKLRNLAGLDYPQELLEFVIVSDGSGDGTRQILAEAKKNDPRVRALIFPEPKGKACRLNDGIAAASGDIVLFVDARQELERDSLRLLMENFAELSVGCVSGQLMLGDAASGEAERGMGIYWRIEKKIRQLESASGSVVGATGAIYAARRALLKPIPPDTILDDVLLPLEVARQGARVVFDERARAWDCPDLGAQREFRRKVRTLTGNYQLVQIAPWVLSPENPLRFRFVCHKLSRLVVPFALATMLVASVFVPEPFYRFAALTQFSFYAMSLLALTGSDRGPVARLSNLSLTVLVLNTAAVVAFKNFLTGHKEVWVR